MEHGHGQPHAWADFNPHLLLALTPIKNLAKLGIVIEVDAAGIGIPASYISVRYRSIPLPDWVPLFRYRTGSGIVISDHSSTGLTECRTVQHSGI